MKRDVELRVDFEGIPIVRNGVRNRKEFRKTVDEIEWKLWGSK